MNDDEKLALVLGHAIEAIEDFSDHYGKSDESKLALIQLLAGLSLATVLERRGLWRMLRTVFGGIVVALRYRRLVQP